MQASAVIGSTPDYEVSADTEDETPVTRPQIRFSHFFFLIIYLKSHVEL